MMGVIGIEGGFGKGERYARRRGRAGERVSGRKGMQIAVNYLSIMRACRMRKRTYSYRDLRVFANAMNVSMNIYELTKTFPTEEKYSLTDQVRRSSRSVCANIAEAWRKRRYRAAFIAKLSDAESEACETQVWLEFARNCGYLDEEASEGLHQEYEIIMRQLMNMVQNVEKWLIPVNKK